MFHCLSGISHSRYTLNLFVCVWSASVHDCLFWLSLDGSTGEDLCFSMQRVGGSDDDEEMEYDDFIEVSDKKKKKKKKASVVKEGAMDAFAKKKDPSNGSSGGGGNAKKRRKKMVEKTTVDDNGYMCTETVEVWEDVEDDDNMEV